jgi:hypothetical protein
MKAFVRAASVALLHLYGAGVGISFVYIYYESAKTSSFVYWVFLGIAESYIKALIWPYRIYSLVDSNELLAWLANISPFEKYIGFIAIGCSVGYLFSTIGRTREIRNWILGTCLILSISLGNPLFNAFRDRNIYRSAVQVLEKERFIQALFHYHPDSRDELLASFKLITAHADINASGDALGDAVAVVTKKYLMLDVPVAAPEAVANLIKLTATRLHELKSSPAKCVGFFTGSRAGTDPSDTELLRRISDVKAVIIQTAGEDPLPRPTPIAAQEMFRRFVTAFKVIKRPVEELQSVNFVASLPVEKGCVVATDYYDALVSMGDEQSSALFKVFTILSQQQS